MFDIFFLFTHDERNHVIIRYIKKVLYHSKKEIENNAMCLYIPFPEDFIVSDAQKALLKCSPVLNKEILFTKKKSVEEKFVGLMKFTVVDDFEKIANFFICRVLANKKIKEIIFEFVIVCVILCEIYQTFKWKVKREKWKISRLH